MLDENDSMNRWEWEVLESFMSVEAVEDGWSDRRVIAALGGAIKADLSA